MRFYTIVGSYSNNSSNSLMLLGQTLAAEAFSKQRGTRFTKPRTEDPRSYKNFLRLSEERFKYLLEEVSPYITKQDTVMRESVPARSKLEVTLHFLATGESFRSLIRA